MSDKKKNKRHRTCEICSALGLQPSNNFFKFPNNLMIRQKWIDFCECEENEITNSASLCSHHFSPENIIRRRDQICILVKGAEPVIFDHSTKQNSNINVNEGPEEIIVTDSNVESPAEMDIEFVNVYEGPEEILVTDSNVEDPAEMNIEFVNVNEGPEETIVTDSNVEGAAEKVTMQSPVASSSQKRKITPLNSSDVEIASNTPRCRKRLLRYIGDVSTSHFQSPTTAKRAFNIAKHEAEKYKRNSIILSKRLNRLKKRVRNYKNAILDLKKKLRISERTAAHLSRYY